MKLAAEVEIKRTEQETCSEFAAATTNTVVSRRKTFTAKWKIRNDHLFNKLSFPHTLLFSHIYAECAWKQEE